MTQIAVLVGELFREGSLSWEQLQSLSREEELRPVLEAAAAARADRQCGRRS